MHSIKLKEDELFNRWKTHIKADDQTFFVQDGAIDPEAYHNSSLKVCSVLKETPVDKDADKNGYHFGDAFRRKLERHGVDYYKTNNRGTLNVLAKRISLIRKVLEGKNEIDLVSLLKESAYINIKKYNGAKTSTIKDLERVAQNDKEFHKEHIDSILKPEILLCGKTRHYLGYIYGGGNFHLLAEDPKKKVRLFHQIENNNPVRLVIEMYHPSHRGSEDELLEKLESLLQSYVKSDSSLF